jgi:two-component system OmpR family response regulator
MTTSTLQRDALTRADGQPVRALVVDDEATLAELLSTALRYEGWQVEHALTGQTAIKQAKTLDPDVILLDVMLPDLSGLEVLRRIRATHPHVPVLFLTAKDAVEDRIAGLTAGGDDYVTKPFSLEEVVARLRALLRRAGAVSEREEAVLTVGDLRMD